MLEIFYIQSDSKPFILNVTFCFGLKRGGIRGLCHQIAYQDLFIADAKGFPFQRLNELMEFCLNCWNIIQEDWVFAN